MWSPPPLCTPSSSTVLNNGSFAGFNSNLNSIFNAQIGAWDVSAVTTMKLSEYIHVYDHVRHYVPMWPSPPPRLRTKSSSILIHPHPQCLILLLNSTLQSGTGM